MDGHAAARLLLSSFRACDTVSHASIVPVLARLDVPRLEVTYGARLYVTVTATIQSGAYGPPFA